MSIFSEGHSTIDHLECVCNIVLICYISSDDFDAAIPFGGYKKSGWGRDKGEYALENYTEVKLIQFPINKY